MNRITYFFLFCIFGGGLMAQEHIAPLHDNPVLRKYAATHPQNLHRAKKATSVSMDSLPFLDDFSKPGPYPDTSKWTDGKVFVNYNLPVCPPTLGVATFDGLDSVGLPYHNNASPYSSLPADTLTSHPIALGSRHPSDSIYLSFYYQQGSRYGKSKELILWPKTSDTLLLQFHKPSEPDSVWHTVWYQLGYGYMPSDSDTTFHLAMIPITDTAYVKNGFRFRFCNYACTSGNVDHWSIDEVYLNAFRSNKDTTQYDVAFAYQSPSLLANYHNEPWEQYAGTNDFVSNVSLFERNNNASATISSGNIIKAQYTYSINTTPVTSYNGGYQNLIPFVDSGYNKYQPQSYPILDVSNFPSSFTGPQTFTMTNVFNAATDFDRWNDTLRYNQIFGNYYAYDDGSAEASYFINGYPGAPVYLADEFNLNTADSIYGIQAFFDYVFVNAHNYTFELALWDASGPGGAPGKMIYEDTANLNVSNPTYDSSGVGRFVTYIFQKPVAVSAGNIYVGWVQTYGDSLNIGIDFNNDHHDKLYFSVNTATWNQSTYNGSIMLHPMLGSLTNYLAVKNIQGEDKTITMYPNPASDNVYLSTALNNATVRIFSEDGRMIWENTRFSGNSINTTELPNGFYIVQLTPKGSKTIFKKLLITK